MPSPRFQFRLSTLLWITLAVACWFGGMRFERWHAEHEAQTQFEQLVELITTTIKPTSGWEKETE
jgi:hypothetical protein